MRFNEFNVINEKFGPASAEPGAPRIKDKIDLGTFNVDVPKGRRGVEVADVQKALVALGYPLPKHGVDGIRGPETIDAVKKFQKDNGLTVDGDPGPATVAKLNDVLKSKPDVASKLIKSTPSDVKKTASVDVPVPDTKGAIKKVIGAGAGYTDVETVDGEQFRRSGARNWRNNNPGNLEFAGGFSQRAGAVGHDGRFAVFPTLEIGMKAKEDLVFGKNYINLSIQGAIAKYAPEKDNNDVEAYVNHIVQSTKATPNTILKDLTPEQRKAMLDAINRFEGFRPGTVVALGPTTTTTA
jgi:peptidoglycan hydrolase-like protein with peptidoglycan-binding domain